MIAFQIDQIIFIIEKDFFGTRLFVIDIYKLSDAYFWENGIPYKNLFYIFYFLYL